MKRDYQNSNDKVRETYYLNHTKQTLDFVLKKYGEYKLHKKILIDFWDIFSYLKKTIDSSDPDLPLPQSIHCFQTGEALRHKYPDLDWLHLVGFMHDFGKILIKFGEPEWAVVGDTFPVGIPFNKNKIIYGDFFNDNPDNLSIELTRDATGIYQPECGFEKVYMSWGHDEYWASVLEYNKEKHSLPPEAIYIIRFHSFYPWHQERAYSLLASEKDWDNLSWLLMFNEADLYSKDVNIDELNEKIENELLPYYQSLVKKYFHQTLLQL